VQIKVLDILLENLGKYSSRIKMRVIMHPEQQNDINTTDLLTRLEKHPMLKARVKEMLDVAENVNGKYIKADDAESAAIELVRQLGNDMLTGWAKGRAIDEAEQCKNDKSIVKQVKKKSIGTAHSVILK
jgi:hypothetical protein